MTTELQALMDATTAANNAIIQMQQTKQAAQDLVDSNKIIQHKIFRDPSRSEYATTSYTAHLQLPLAISITPQSTDSHIIIKAGGNFRATSTAGLKDVGIRMYLYDGDTDLTGQWTMVYDSYTTNIHHAPLLCYVDARGGLAIRNYNVRVKAHGASNSGGYVPGSGAGFMEVWEIKND